MKEEKNIILEGVFSTIPTNITCRIYPTEVYLKYFDEQMKKFKQELRLKKLNRLLDELE